MSGFNKPMRLDSHELQLRLQKLERRFNNMERKGTISDVKYDKEAKRWMVKFNDGEDLEPAGDQGDDKPSDTFKTGWRPWKQFANGAVSFSVPPKKGQKVTLRSPNGYPEQGYVEAFHNGPETTSPHDKEDEVVMQIIKPKKQEQNQNGSSGGSSGQSDQSSEEEDDTALRISTKNGGYTITVGKLGDSQTASHSDGNGEGSGDKKTFQMTITRDLKKITCGDFKAELGKDGAKLSYGDDISLELNKDQIKSKVKGSEFDITEGKMGFTGTRLEHEGKNIGKDHKHLNVQPGGGKTGDPDV